MEFKGEPATSSLFLGQQRSGKGKLTVGVTFRGEGSWVAPTSELRKTPRKDKLSLLEEEMSVLLTCLKIGVLATIGLSLLACQSAENLSSILSSDDNSGEQGLLVQSESVAATATVATKVSPPATTPYPRRPFTLTDQVKPGSSFYEFRARLQQAVRTRDAKFIRAIAASDIKLSFGPPMKLDELEIDRPTSLFWQRLERIISTGCAPYEAPPGKSEQIQTWACPHVFQASLGEPFSDVYIVGSNINVRSRPHADTPVVAVVSNEVVKSDPHGFSALSDSQRAAMQTFDGWQPIIAPNGQRGFVSSRFAYVPAGYRGLFENRGGTWKMTVFITGD